MHNCKYSLSIFKIADKIWETYVSLLCWFTYIHVAFSFSSEPEKSDTRLPMWWLCWVLIKPQVGFHSFIMDLGSWPNGAEKTFYRLSKKYGEHTRHRPEMSVEKTFYTVYPANLLSLRSNNLILRDFQQKEHAFGRGSRWVCFMCSSWKAAFMCRQTQRHLGLS